MPNHPKEQLPGSPIAMMVMMVLLLIAIKLIAGHIGDSLEQTNTRSVNLSQSKDPSQSPTIKALRAAVRKTRKEDAR